MGGWSEWLLAVAVMSVIGLWIEVGHLRRYCNNLNDRLNAIGSRARRANDDL